MARPLAGAGWVNMRVLLGHQLPFDELFQRMEWWIWHQKHGLYKRAVQKEESEKVRWFFRSTLDTNIQDLQQALKQVTSIELGLKWRPVLHTSRAYDARVAIRTVHVECPKGQGFEVLNALHPYYSA